MEFQEKLKSKTKNIGLEVIKLVEDMPNKPAACVLSKQIIGSSTSVGANYRAACRAKSIINKLKIVEEEADETIYWLDLIQESYLVPADKLKSVNAEISELLSIIVTAIKTTRKRYIKN